MTRCGPFVDSLNGITMCCSESLFHLNPIQIVDEGKNAGAYIQFHVVGSIKIVFGSLNLLKAVILSPNWHITGTVAFHKISTIDDGNDSFNRKDPTIVLG